MEQDFYYLDKRFGRYIPGLLKTDRAVIYLRQQLISINREISERVTKTIGDTYYRITRLRHELFPLFRMTGEMIIAEKIIELTDSIGQRTIKEEASALIISLINFLDTYKTQDDGEISLLKEKIDKLEQELYEKSEVEDQELVNIEDASTVFVIMPFNKDFADVWKGGIERAAKNEGFNPLRVDTINKSSNITDDIIESIKKCNIAIVDVSSNNPNVMFELGFAIALGKPNIIISQSVEQLPFDIRNIRTILYSNSWSGIEELRTKIQEFLREFKPKASSTPTKKNVKKK